MQLDMVSCVRSLEFRPMARGVSCHGTSIHIPLFGAQLMLQFLNYVLAPLVSWALKPATHHLPRHRHHHDHLLTRCLSLASPVDQQLHQLNIFLVPEALCALRFTSRYHVRLSQAMFRDYGSYRKAIGLIYLPIITGANYLGNHLHASILRSLLEDNIIL